MRTVTFLLLFSLQAFADFDLSVNTQGRTYPSLGGSVNATAGYNQSLWGEVSKTDPFYSMLRTQIVASTSGVVSDIDYQISLYPISFLAIGVGRQEMTSEYEDFVGYDCDKIRCQGQLNKDYAFAKIILAYSGLIGSFQYKISRINYDDPDNKEQPVAEYTSMTKVQAGDEVSLKRDYFIGYKQDQVIFGGLSTYEHFQNSNQESHLNTLIIQKTYENVEALIGTGSFHTTQIKAGTVVIFKLTYKILSNNAIF